jgi:hypothetical protein
VNPQYEAHERMCKAIGDMAKENEALKQHVTELENRLRALWDKLEGERKHYMERIKRLEEALESIREYWNGDNSSRAMIDACWYAIDKASEALESKERIELLMSANADVARIAAERDAAERRVMHLEAALRKIADQDYRGNRSTESQIALMALEVKP